MEIYCLCQVSREFFPPGNVNFPIQSFFSSSLIVSPGKQSQCLNHENKICLIKHHRAGKNRESRSLMTCSSNYTIIGSLNSLLIIYFRKSKFILGSGIRIFCYLKTNAFLVITLKYLILCPTCKLINYPATWNRFW